MKFYSKFAKLAGLEDKIVLTEDEAFAEICKALGGE